MYKLKGLNLLFIEDNTEFAKNTIEFLDIYFKEVLYAKSIKKALEIINDLKVDVIISDIKLFDGNGLDFIEQLRKLNSKIPIVILSAYKNEDLLLQAIPLNILAYETKPLSYDRFISLLEKISAKYKPKSIITLSKNIKYNTDLKEIFLNNRTIKLTKKEICFVEFLLHNKEKVITHEMIQRDVWQNKHMSDSAIKNLILRLRKKIGQDFIVSLGGVGYRLSHTH